MEKMYMKTISTIDDIRSLFLYIKNGTDWSLHLMKITNSKSRKTNYYVRQILLEPSGKIGMLVDEISDNYTSGDYSVINKYEKIEDYDGANVGKIIYRLPVDSLLINERYADWLQALNSSEIEGELDITKYHGYIINGYLDGGEPVRMISMQSPISSYDNKYRFFCSGASFRAIEGNVLQLKKYIDAVIYKGNLYMMNLDAERIFDMERAFKKKSFDDAQNIVDYGMVSDRENFLEIALSGHNPRKFLSFNAKNLEILKKNKQMRKKLGNKFDIPLTKSGEFDTTDKRSCDNLIKILCDKAMLEPFDEEPREVESAKKWK